MRCLVNSAKPVRNLACKSKSDHSIFYRNFSSDIIMLVVYVDDIVIIGSYSKSISSLKSFLQS